jgi:transposase
MAISDAAGLPIAIWATAANPHEVTLVEETLDKNICSQSPKLLIADKAYDSDKLRDFLESIGIELISPHRRNRKKKKRQNGRKLRRYKRRWKIERVFAWLHNYRRCVVRYDRWMSNFSGFISLSCIMIYLKKYF